MNFITDITRLLDRTIKGRLPTGVDRVILEYIRHFQNKSLALVRFGGRWVVLNERRSTKIFNALLQEALPSPWLLRFLVAQAYILDRQQPKSNAIVLNIGHSGLQDPNYQKRLMHYECRGFYFLHDIIPITHPEYCRPGEKKHHHQRLKTMLTTANGIVLNSAATGKDLIAYAEHVGINLPPFAVAHLAPGRLPDPQPARISPHPYFVMLGTIEPRKNHLLILHVWRELVEKLGKDAPHLVLIGQRGWECEQIVDLLDRCEKLQGAVFELPQCTDQELATWLKHAQGLLFPSFAEGYGMPLVEALALGTPVLASDLPVFREIAGNIPEYLDPLDGLGWLQTILDYTNTHHPRRKNQCCRMVGWQPPTWEDHFSRVDHLLEKFAQPENS